MADCTKVYYKYFREGTEMLWYDSYYCMEKRIELKFPKGKYMFMYRNENCIGNWLYKTIRTQWDYKRVQCIPTDNRIENGETRESDLEWRGWVT